MFCTNCGKQIPDTAAFCPNCGTPVRVKPAAPVIPAAPVPPVQIPQAEIPNPPVEIPQVPQEAAQTVEAAQEKTQPALEAAQELGQTQILPEQPPIPEPQIPQSEIPQPPVQIPQPEIPQPPVQIPQPEIPQPPAEVPQEAVKAVETAQQLGQTQVLPEQPAFTEPPAEIPQGQVPPQGFEGAANYPAPPAGANVPPQGFVPPYPPQGAPSAPPAKEKKEKGPKKSIFKNKFFYIGLAAVLLVAAGIVLFLLLGGTTTYDLKEYVKVEYDGYEGNGEANVYVDTDALEEKIFADKKIDLENIDSLSAYTKALNKAIEIEEALATIDVQATPTKNLKNGDVITVKLSYDEETASKQKLKFLCEDQQITVEGLPKLKEIDPFASLTVTFSGISGSGEAEFEYTGTDDLLSEYSFDVLEDNQYSLKNGDEITVAVSSYYDDETVAFYGLHLSKREQKYTVSGLVEYVTEFSQISSAGMETLRSVSISDIKDALKDVDAKYAMGEPEYAGYALGVADDPDEYTRNYLYLIYKVKLASVPGVTMPATLYLPVKFDDITNAEDVESKYYAYGVKGYTKIIGASDYFSGYFDPYEVAEEILEANEGYTFTFGDGFEDYNDEAQGVTSFADVPQETIDAAFAYVTERAKTYAKDNYLSTTKISDFTAVGEYLYVAKDQTLDLSDRTIFVMIIKAKVTDSDKKIDTWVYMPFEFDGLLKTKDGIYHLSYGSGIFWEDELAEGYTTAGLLDLKTLDNTLQNTLTDIYECIPSERMKAAVK